MATACNHNGVVDSGEQCDDGNSNPADGCNACRAGYTDVLIVQSTMVSNHDVFAAAAVGLTVRVAE